MPGFMTILASQISQSYLGKSAFLQQFLRPGLCWQNLKHSAKVRPLDKGRKKMNIYETIFNTCKEWAESTCWFLLQDNVKAAAVIPQKAVLQITSSLFSNTDPSTIRDCRHALELQKQYVLMWETEGFLFYHQFVLPNGSVHQLLVIQRTAQEKRLQQPSMAPGAGYTKKLHAFKSARFSFHLRTNKQCPLLSSTNTTAHTSLGISEMKTMIECKGVDLLFLSTPVVLLFSGEPGFPVHKQICSLARRDPYYQTMPKNSNIFDVTSSLESNVKHMYLSKVSQLLSALHGFYF